MMSERERIARLIRIHSYVLEYGTCTCVLASLYGDNATSFISNMTRMSIIEHSLHVADRIQWRRHRVDLP